MTSSRGIEPIEIELGERKLLAVRADRPAELGRHERRPASASSTTRPARSATRSPPSCRAGGCCSCRCTCSPAPSCSGSTPAPARRRTCTRPAAAAFSTIGWEAAQLAERHGDVIDLLAAIVDGIARGDFMIAPWKESSACTYCDFKPICPRGPESYMERQRRRPAAGDVRRADPGRPMTSGVLVDAARARADRRGARREPVRRGRRRHRARRPCSSAGREPARRRRRDRRSAGGDHVHREGGGRAVDPGARRARAAGQRCRGRGATTPPAGRGARPVPRRTSRRSTASRPRCCASAQSRRASTRCSRCSTGSPPASTFDAAYERFQDELLASDDPDARAGAAPRVRARRSCARRASTCTRTATCSRSRTPAHPAASLDQTLARPARDRRRAAGADAHAQPRRDKLVDVVERIVDWIDGLDALDARRARASCSSPAPGRRRTRGSARTRTGAGEKQRSRSCRTATTTRSTPPRLSLRTDALLGLLPRIERFVREYAQDRKRRGKADFDDLLFWARDLLRDQQPARRLLPPALPRRADRRVPGHRPGPGRARAAPDQRPGPERGLARAAARARPTDRRRRPQAVDLPLPPRRHRRLRPGQDAARWPAQPSRSSPTSAPTSSCCARSTAAFDADPSAREPGVQPANVELEPPPGRAERAQAAAGRRSPRRSVEGRAPTSVRKEEARVDRRRCFTPRTSEQWEIRDRRDEDRWRPAAGATWRS